eukprot:412029_1
MGNRLLKLNYFTPKYSPHGLFGVIQLSLGLILLSEALNGYLDRFQNGSILSILYWLSSIGMCIGAATILKQADPTFRFIFRFTAIIEAVLIYFAYGFSIYFVNFGIITRCIDFILGLLFIVMTPILTIYSFQNLNVFAGGLYCSLFTTFGYVIPVMLYGQLYIDCIDNTWPMQNVGFVSYVFGAITTILSLCMFMITLVTRNVLPRDGIVTIFAFIVRVFGINCNHYYARNYNSICFNTEINYFLSTSYA